MKQQGRSSCRILFFYSTWFQKKYQSNTDLVGDIVGFTFVWLFFHCMGYCNINMWLLLLRFTKFIQRALVSHSRGQTEATKLSSPFWLTTSPLSYPSQAHHTYIYIYFLKNSYLVLVTIVILALWIFKDNEKNFILMNSYLTGSFIPHNFLIHIFMYIVESLQCDSIELHIL